MSNADKKTQYFSNGDFEKVAANIISSPRRMKPAFDDSMDALFKIDEKQQAYYTKCFRHLMKTTQGFINLSGALSGADERIVAFFRRSSLDVPTLSKIWTLADVNEDGWLDLAEFSIAMHLVVLRVKGEVPIPDALPFFAKPPYLPPRVGSQCSANPSSAPSSEALSQSLWQSEEIGFTVPDGKSFSHQPVIKQFSDTPPLLVDSRPTAIKHSALLALKSPSGPPPIPPNRPQQKGHARSASLDLKLIALNNGKFPTSTSDNLKPPNTLSLWSTTTSDVGVTSFKKVAERDSIQPPPIPQRISPSPLPKLIEEPKTIMIDTETQTEGKVYNEEEIKQFFDRFDSKLENLLGDEVEGNEKELSTRCAILRKQNAELEAERARLAQVRIQLEIRLQEIEERSKMATSSSAI